MRSLLSRRDFLHVGIATSGGLLVGCQDLPDSRAVAGSISTDAPASGVVAAAKSTAPVHLGVFIEIAPDNSVVLVTPQTEMGQGVHDGLTKILADELDADWSRVSVRLPWADAALASKVIKRQRTANSDSTMNYMQQLRETGAAARAVLIAAAAQRWNVPAEQCRSALSTVRHDASGREASYGELAAEAAAMALPAEVKLKTPAQFTLIGKPTPRKDTPPKVDGSAVFGIDVRQDGMLYAVLRRSPAVSSKLVSFDRDSALRQKGVIDVFAVADGVAVIANSTWAARRAADTMTASFDDSASKEVEQKLIQRRLREALNKDDEALAGRPAFGGGPFDKEATLTALKNASQRREWTYEVPFLAHAALEPLCATVLVTDEQAEAWAPTQQPDTTRDQMAELTGLPREKCRLNVTFLGGGFGRKFETDFVRQAVEIANKKRGTPIKLTWTREQDFLHDRYRPAHVARTRVGLDRDGNLAAMHSRITGLSMWRYKGRPAMPGFGDPFATGGLINDRYAIPNAYVDHVATDEPIPIGTWRSVSASMNCFFFESAIEDVAAVTRQDSMALRRRLLAKDTRAIAVLDAVGERSGWGRPLPKGRGLGIAISLGFGSYCAQAIEVTVRGQEVHVDRIVCAFDCGFMIDPRAVEAQVEGGVIWGLSAARDGSISFAGGAAAETNFHQAPILRLSETPPIETLLLPGSDKPGGAGEASVPPVAPALAAAIFAATGKRPRRLPLIAEGYRFV